MNLHNELAESQAKIRIFANHIQQKTLWIIFFVYSSCFQNKEELVAHAQ